MTQSDPASGAEPYGSGRRACRSCKALNTVNATHCWQCFAPVDGPLGMAPGSLGMPSGPSSALREAGRPLPPPAFGRPPATIRPEDHAASSVRTGRLTVGGILKGVIALAIVVVAGATLIRTLASPDIALPSSIDGLARIEEPQLDQALSQLTFRARDAGFEDIQVGIYGGDQVAFMVGVMGYRGTETVGEIFDATSQGFASSALTGISIGSVVPSQTDGADFACAQVTGVQGNLCMWKDDATVGFVLAFDRGLEQSQQLAAAARAAVHS